MFESMLDTDTYVLGVDEHTGLVIDLDAATATVVGNSNVTIRLRGNSFVYPTGSVIPLSLLQSPASLLNDSQQESDTARVVTTPKTELSAQAPVQDGSLENILIRTKEEFDAAMVQRDAVTAVRSVLALEQGMKNWSADTLTSDVLDRARSLLRSMISQLGDAAVNGVKDPRAVVSPFVEAMLAVRATVRAEKRFDLSDIIRDVFSSLNIEVRDTPTGVEWSLPAD
jgi:cysteinyl-tRNA synthetase